MSVTDGGPPIFCKWCPRESVRRQGRIWLCAKHYRFQQMRVSARRDAKDVPSYADLEAITDLSWMVCAGCGQKMHWLVSDGSRTLQATLQHDRAGTYRLLCLGCNTRHAAHPGDEFYQVGIGFKRCPSCASVKPFSAFAVDRSRPIGRKSSCRECSRGQHRRWVQQNRAYVNAKQREGRARRATC